MAGEGVPPGSVPPPISPDVQNINEMKAFIGNMMLDIGVKVSEKMAGLMANQFSAPVIVQRGDPETGEMREEKTSVAQLLAEIADDIAYIADACGDDDDDDLDEPSNGRKRGMDKGKKKRGR